MEEYPTAEWNTPLNLARQRDKHNEDHTSMITSINHCSYEVSKLWTWISPIHQQKFQGLMHVNMGDWKYSSCEFQVW